MGIGEAFGDFLAFDRVTEMKTHLRWARMKTRVKGNTWSTMITVTAERWPFSVTLCGNYLQMARACAEKLSIHW